MGLFQVTGLLGNKDENMLQKSAHDFTQDTNLKKYRRRVEKITTISKK